MAAAGAATAAPPGAGEAGPREADGPEGRPPAGGAAAAPAGATGGAGEGEGDRLLLLADIEMEEWSDGEGGSRRVGAAKDRGGAAAPLRGLPLLGWIAVGLINNLPYVVFITAAEVLLTGHSGLVLLCSVAPGFLVKTLGGVVLYRVPYGPRVAAVSAVSAAALVLTAIARTTAAALCGVCLASLGSGLGELSFLALTSRAPPGALAAWGAGTGGAGIAGAALWILLHDASGLSGKATLLLCAPLPLLLVLAFAGPVRGSTAAGAGAAGGKEVGEGGALTEATKRETIRRILLPYMAPLFVVYFFEYTINQALYLPLGLTAHGLEVGPSCTMYPRLQLTYQVGVLASRSSLFFFKVPYPGLMAFLQFATFSLLLIQVLARFMAGGFAVVGITVLSLWEGCLGGACYVNAIHMVTEVVEPERREFALSVVAIADTCGILFAGIISSALEGGLLKFLRVPDFRC